MKILNHKQGSAAWIRARLGRPTTSEFANFVKPSTGKPSASKGADTYRNRCVAERIIGEPLTDFQSSGMERGSSMEVEAAGWYALETGLSPSVVGFVLTDDERAGCSPDRLVGSTGLLEMKCPMAHTQVGYVLNPTSLFEAYRVQVMGQLLVTGREWVDMLSYSPVMASVIYRVNRADHVGYLLNLADSVKAFCDAIDAAHKAVIAADPLGDQERADAAVFA